MPTSLASVATTDGARFRKQLVSHLGRKNTVEEVAGTDDLRLVLPYGSCLLSVGNDALVLEAAADGVEDLEHVERVVGSHLERFGHNVGLTVHWTRPDEG